MPSKSGTGKDPRLAPIKARGLMPPVAPREAVADELRRRIKDGVYPPGETLPSIPELIAMTEGTAAKNTVMAALKTLAGEGMVKSIQGVGTYVMTPEYWTDPK